MDTTPLRILISTDNHLGYAEKNAVIGDDSFRNFEEVLKTARELDVDFVLLGGDLFHEAEPTKQTFVRLDRLLSQYCLYDKDVAFRIVESGGNLAEPRVNFENPNLRVGLPVFSIHGNHDYPHGDASLSAMDVPSSSGLINYFGKKDIGENGDLTLRPILMTKGSTRLALYGLGHIADQRVGTVFRKPGAVQWIRPSEMTFECDQEWFNLFVLHQNRVQRGFSNTHGWIEDRHLAAYEDLDFVLWGHEHQCLTETQPSAVGDFHVLQPGSTVATSLAEGKRDFGPMRDIPSGFVMAGEADAKHVFLLEVFGDAEGNAQHRVSKHRLRGVRPFRFANVVLAEQYGVYPTQEHTVKEFVRWKLEAMVADAYRDHPEMLPLIRLRIDYTGFDIIRTQEMQKRFACTVANPDDMLLWVKKPKRREKPTAAAVQFRSDVQEPALMDELIMAELQGNLKMISLHGCTTAFQSVIFSNTHASIRNVFSRQIAQFQERLMKESDVTDEETARDAVKRFAAEIAEKEPSWMPYETLEGVSNPDRRRVRVTSTDDDQTQLHTQNPPQIGGPSLLAEETTTSDAPSPPSSRVSQAIRQRGSYRRPTKRRK